MSEYLRPFHDLTNGRNRLPIHGMVLRNLPDIAAVLLTGGECPLPEIVIRSVLRAAPCSLPSEIDIYIQFI
jgi:hypothetical protein